MTQEQFDAFYNEFNAAWKSNQDALDNLTDEIGDDGFVKIELKKADDALLGKFYRWQKLMEVQAELKAVKLPSVSDII